MVATPVIYLLRNQLFKLYLNHPMPSLLSVILPFVIGGALIMCVTAILLEKNIDVFSFWGTAAILCLPPLLTFLIAFV